MIRLPVYKPNDPKCSCVTDHYECWYCREPKIKEIIRRQTPAQRAYDMLANAGWPNDDYDYEVTGCSCHINPPCDYCVTHCADCDKHQDDCTCS